MISNCTVKLYYSNTYQKSFDAEIINCVRLGDTLEIELDRTAFYPEGGGQPHDIGYVNGYPVLDVKENNGRVIHTLSTDKPQNFRPEFSKSEIAAGTRVSCEIDWPYRFRLMQHHSGEHIISGLAKKLFGLDNVGFHMGTDCVTIDLNGSLTDNDLWVLERAANEAVYRNQKIESSYPDETELETLIYRSKKKLEGEVRIVRVPDYDACACCGLHVAATGEIGIIKLVSSQSYKGGVRLSMLCGTEALADYYYKNCCIHDISAMLSAKQDRVREAVGALQTENMNLKSQIWKLKGQMLEMKAAGFGSIEKICVFEEGLDPGDLKRFCELLITEKENDPHREPNQQPRQTEAVVFSGTDETGYKYALGGINSVLLAKEMASELSARGGGAKGIVQGKIPATSDAIKTFFAARCWEIRDLKD